MARLSDISETLQGEEKRILDEMIARRERKPGGPYVPLLHHPELACHIERLGYYLKFEATLPRDVYQFVVLSIAARFNAEFEWADHEMPARQSGLPEDIIEALRTKNAGAITGGYASVAEAMEHILGYRSIPDRLQQELTGMYGITGVIEIVILCGFYQLIGEVNASFDVPLPSERKGDCGL
jgi:4-carboxymuconolactone decarboxylase